MPDPSALEALTKRLGPPRIASLIVTIWGDAVAPRGGSLWLGSLQQILDHFGCNPGQVRTAMSRLTEEGWLARNRVGRNSFYRLGPRGEAAFGAAARRIYRTVPPAWDGQFRLAMTSDPAVVEALVASQFGQAAPGLWIGLRGAAEALPAAATVLMATPRHLAEARDLAARAWPLEAIAAAHERFVEAFAPLDELRPEAAEALPLRLRLVHEWRRIALRDPALPDALLPERWPGRDAAALAARLYARLVPAAEAWLDEAGRAEAGQLPPAELAGRFGLG
ncbi:PaaX family transcriptional regulator [Falsiroseomonas ponticola]|uniref:PaaX family transcriptional regulator n=1 Tax=Falsiroseomonas ponticola TaxID=2786951 RepID=UPI0019340231|nr:PaaX family transcriptional regulator C-terminal domain-containing protein [Roseomonas ponticola]